MAKQKGPNKIQGTIGDINYYKSQDGFLLREKGGVDANRILTDPKFQRTRENNAEFGRAGAASKLLRTALQGVMQNTADNRVMSRLIKAMVAVVKADGTNTRGNRNVVDGNLDLLQGFEFNKNSQLASALFAPFTAAVDRVAGQLKVTIPAFLPANMVAAPTGATHFQFISAGAEIDFGAGTYVMSKQSSDMIALTTANLAEIDLTDAVTPNSTHPLFLAFGIVFSQMVNGVSYPLSNGAYNALALVKVDGGA